MILLAETSPADFMISGTWLLGFCVGIIPVIGGVWIKAKQVGRAETQDNNVTLKKPVPTIQTREEPQWATRPDLNEHVARTERHFSDVWKRFEADRTAARESANNIHKRLDKQSEATAAVQASLNEVKETTHTLLDIALNKPLGRKPGPRS